MNTGKTITMLICPRCKATDDETLTVLPSNSKKGSGKGKSKFPHVWCGNCNQSFNPMIPENEIKCFCEKVGIEVIDGEFYIE
jgi:hypothetical protein